MKILIAILSCKKDQVWHQQARETWLVNCPVDYKFFLGKLAFAYDEVELDAPDSSRHLYKKTQRMIQYAFENEYDFLFKCDIDTYVHVPRLLKSGFEKHEFSGYNGAYGGSGYWLSRQAMKVLLESPSLDWCPTEDGWVYHSLGNRGIRPFQDKRYHSLTSEGPAPENDLITSHWYSDHSQNPERIVHSKERLNLIPVLHKKAQEIKEDA
jgi:hypothetical protein